MKTAFQYENHYELKKNRLKVLDAVDYTCAICGCEAVLVHHKDGSRDNHAPNNLLPLCQKCHSKLHSKINRVRWDGRAIEAAMMQKGIDRRA